MLLAAGLAAGCAGVSGPAATSAAPAASTAASAEGHPDDPWEGFNRGIFAFNEKLDAWVLKPVAKGYDAVTPTPVRVGVANFFGNLGDVWVGTNNLLQGKPRDAASDLGRFVVNSTMGVAGLIDVASPMGLDKHGEDFGQTLAVWGLRSGPYLVLPVLGPSTARDAGGTVFDLGANAVNLFDPESARYLLNGLNLIDRRAELLPSDKVVEEAALDKYSYFRSAFLQRRHYLIFDGNPPREEIPE
ncbi:MAG TPA: VacJ family lipoprotein [Rhodocyclaceae bacterium]|nr:VacJ family lipoprotein [Rhodocyclaceae bacterium]